MNVYLTGKEIEQDGHIVRDRLSADEEIEQHVVRGCYFTASALDVVVVRHGDAARISSNASNQKIINKIYLSRERFANKNSDNSDEND